MEEKMSFPQRRDFILYSFNESIKNIKIIERKNPYEKISILYSTKFNEF
jgi:hypothetical protein